MLLHRIRLKIHSVWCNATSRVNNESCITSNSSVVVGKLLDDMNQFPQLQCAGHLYFYITIHYVPCTLQHLMVRYHLEWSLLNVETAQIPIPPGKIERMSTIYNCLEAFSISTFDFFLDIISNYQSGFTDGLQMELNVFAVYTSLSLYTSSGYQDLKTFNCNNRVYFERVFNPMKIISWINTWGILSH